MMRIPGYLSVIALCLLPLSRADVRACQCDVAIPETLEARECGLCKEAESNPPMPLTFSCAMPTQTNFTAGSRCRAFTAIVRNSCSR